MTAYTLEHWRGRHSLLRSCIINGVVINFITYTASLIIIGLLLGGIVSVTRANLSNGAVIAMTAYLAIVPDIVITVWSCVGIFRSGHRHWSNTKESLRNRMAALAAILFGVAIAVWTAWGVVELAMHISDIKVPA